MDEQKKQKLMQLWYSCFRMVSVGVVDEPVNQAYDIISTLALLANLTGSIAVTFDSLGAKYGELFSMIEAVTVFFFGVDYCLRVFTARFQYPKLRPQVAVIAYIFSFTGIVDLLSFLPYYMPVFFPSGAAVFRMFRVVRILRLFRINAYYDSLNVITEVIVSKRQQLLSSVFIVLTMMLASSLCMYSVEHEVQPEVFSNAFSGIWWSASTLLTVGYGDIYPITTVGKTLGILIAFLGVGMVAIPTGIISAGFVEQYSLLKRIGEVAQEEDIHFIKLRLSKRDSWVGKEIKDLRLPHGAIIAGIQRGEETIVPRGHVKLKRGDKLILGAEAIKNDRPVNLKEIILKKNHPWNGLAIKDLDISRQTLIIMVKRHDRTLIPRGDLVLYEGDTILLFTKVKTKTKNSEEINIEI